VRPIRDLDPVDIDTLVAVRGMVTRAGNIIPDLRCEESIALYCCVALCIMTRGWVLMMCEGRITHAFVLMLWPCHA
jgi:DNA replicative helicase MCM subunit Mcm2 (Cdc46/Mcm family)